MIAWQPISRPSRPSRILSVFMTGVWFLVGMVVPLAGIVGVILLGRGF
jgi:hypothetical protein